MHISNYFIFLFTRDTTTRIIIELHPRQKFINKKNSRKTYQKTIAGAWKKNGHSVICLRLRETFIQEKYAFPYGNGCWKKKTSMYAPSEYQLLIQQLVFEHYFPFKYGLHVTESQTKNVFFFFHLM